MKNMVLLTILLFSSLSYAQIKTGGGVWDGGQAIFPIEDVSGTRSAEHLFLEHLRLKHLTCSTINFKAMQIDFNFLKAYTQLSIIKSSYEVKGLCGLINPYLKCIGDSEYFELLQELKVDYKFEQKMTKIQKVEADELARMLNFFGNLPKGCTSFCE